MPPSPDLKPENQPDDRAEIKTEPVAPVEARPGAVEETVAPAVAPGPPKKVYAKTSTVIVMMFVFAAGVAVIMWAWNLGPFQTSVVTTDNSYVRGQVTVLAPQVSGYITEVAVGDYQKVRQGDVLFRIDDRTYRQQLDESKAELAVAVAERNNSEQSAAQNRAAIYSAEASVAEAKAELDRTNADFARVDGLSEKGVATQRELDQARAASRSADAGVRKADAEVETARQVLRSTEVARGSLDAKVEGAQAAVDLAEINLSNTIVKAPRDGQVSEATARPGQYVTSGSQLTFLVPNKVWVIANFKETQMANMVIGQPAEFKVDGMNGAVFKGVVEQISPAAGSEFSVLRPDNASGNFTKVVQRIPVRIAITPDQPGADRLRPGMSVTTEVDTSGQARRPAGDMP